MIVFEFLKAKIVPVILSIGLALSSLFFGVKVEDNDTSDYAETPITATETYTDPTPIVEATLTETNGVYTIANLTDLGALVQICTEANNYLAGKTVVLTSDIDMTGVSASIGTFAGTFDGNGKTLKNVTASLIGTLNGGAVVKNTIIDTITVSGETVGLIETVNATADVTIANVAVKNANISGTVAAGGIVGSVSGTAKVAFTNCTVAGAVKGSAYTGGLAGYVTVDTASVSFENCKNAAELTTQASSGEYFMGGMVGFSYAITATGCLNEGTITSVSAGTHSTLGGMVGRIFSKTSSFTNCVNKATIKTVATSGYNHNNGGIIGHLNTNASTVMLNCDNHGESTRTTSTGGGGRHGGMIGWAQGKADLDYCGNYANITGAVQVGGMIGDSRHASTTLDNCFNSGSVTEEVANGNVAGMVGLVNAKTVVNNCVNTGDVFSNGGVSGGIFGKVQANYTVTACTNLGNIYSDITVDSTTGAIDIKASNASPSGLSRIGGIIGHVQPGSATTGDTVTNCLNLGNVMGTNCVGGIVGYIQNSTVVIDGCVNNADLTVGYNAGAIVGRVNATVTIQNCNALGSLTYKYSSGTNKGVIVGCKTTTPTITNCNGFVIMDGAEKAWVGSADSTNTKAQMIDLMGGIVGVDVQKSAVDENGKYTALFVAGLNNTEIDAIGVQIVRIEDGKAPSAVVDKTTESIFKAMYGYDASGAETVVKASAYTGITYLAGAEIYNIPADKTVTYIVCPYTVSGDTVTYGIACTVTFPAAD